MIQGIATARTSLEYLVLPISILLILRRCRTTALISLTGVGSGFGLSLTLATPSITYGQSYSVIIRNGRVIDGTGNP